MCRHILAAGLLLTIAAPAPAGTITYSYDALGRLQTATASPGKTQSYSYDPAGNRTLVTPGSTANSPPVAVNDSMTATCPGAHKNVLANDSDPDGDALTIIGVTGSVYASFTGSYVSIEPAPSYSGTITVTYTISDGRGGTASATFSAYFPKNWCFA